MMPREVSVYCSEGEFGLPQAVCRVKVRLGPTCTYGWSGVGDTPEAAFKQAVELMIGDRKTARIVDAHPDDDLSHLRTERAHG